jgi:hypothetical protein
MKVSDDYWSNKVRIQHPATQILPLWNHMPLWNHTALSNQLDELHYELKS